jgi:hypothetical protein
VKLISQLEIAELLSTDRETVRKKVAPLVATPGPKNAKLYESDKALPLCLGLGGPQDGEWVDMAEAQRLLTVKRGAQIDLEMEVTRGDRWPKDDVEAIHEASLSNVAGILKAHEGKPLSAELIRDIFTELREVPAKLAKL